MTTTESKILKPEIYKALQDVVGEEHISQEPAILDGYSFVWGNEFVWGSRFSLRPLAAILPGTTKEVQAIVKVCNRYGVKFKAHSTGFSVAAIAGHEPFLVIDLRRMDRILEIDNKNMFAVIEPYVSFAALMNKAMKNGLRPYVIGAGPSCSVLANATSMTGYGTTNVSAGFGGRTPLAVEWVLPDGEILTIGTLGAIGEWWSGDGPGISLRGMMRGIVGARGALGVVTKAAIKLVPWYGPPKLESVGPPPLYKVEIPDSMRVITVVFQSRKSMYQALDLIQKERIAYWCSRRGPFTMVAAATGSNQDVLDMWKTGQFQERLEKFTNNLSIGLNASSSREMLFKTECLTKILEKTGGEEINEDINAITARFVHAFNGLGATKGTFRSTGAMGSNPSAEESLDSVKLAHEKGVELKEKYSKSGLVMADGDSTWVTLIEDMCGHMEVPIRYDPSDPLAVAKAREHLDESNKAITDWRLGIGEFEGGSFGGSHSVHEYAGPQSLNYHTWMKKIKKIFDPNLVGESSTYPIEE